MTRWLDGWTVVFDLDGTLVDTAPDLLNALNHVLTHAGLEAVDLQTVATMIGHGAKAMIRKGMEHQGKTPGELELEGLFARFLVYYSEHIAVGSRPFDRAPEVLDELAAAGAILAVCTNKKQDLSDQLLRELGLAPRFASIIGADSVPSKKPDGDHIVRTVRAAGGDPARAIMVGDSRTDERAARNAGLPFIFVPFGYEAESVEAIGADAVVTHYSLLAPALSRLVG
ncbi:MAG TPA: HAD-IA family hydrolase [Hyphomonas sp.]|nr:HAD-IA family hydrolase [Hyphomonas sp.]HRX73906.1 HAD-IA family hydrolase [Hyphomonas sp.]